ncbi:hypothetical protein N9O61_06760 [Octadecabacter sp.]|nr:hypothetical protein [Octadecabacter sp.]
MEMNAMSTKLHSILNADGRKLENFKFFPGDKRGITESHLCEAGAVAIEAAFEGGLIDNPPETGDKKRSL